MSNVIHAMQVLHLDGSGVTAREPETDSTAVESGRSSAGEDADGVHRPSSCPAAPTMYGTAKGGTADVVAEGKAGPSEVPEEVGNPVQ